ncbi:MAG: hypothetical protein Q4C34_08555 [Bacteroidales bacterium]|nr:hypothetical protein [Bacteroidales bacterium]
MPQNTNNTYNLLHPGPSKDRDPGAAVAERAFHKTLTHFGLTAADIFTREFHTPRHLVDHIGRGAAGIFDIKVQTTLPHARLRNRMLRHFVETLAALAGAEPALTSSPATERLRRLAAIMRDTDPEPTPLQIYRVIMTPESRCAFVDYFNRTLSRLPARARTLINDREQPVETIVGLFGHPLTDYVALCPDGREMRKTVAIAYAFAVETSRAFHRIASMDGRMLLRHRIDLTYPFLFGTSRRFVTGYIESSGRLPLFHIIEQYIHYSPMRDDRIFRLIKGLTNDEPSTTRMLAKEHGISTERVRQLAEAGPHMINLKWFRDIDAAALYPDLSNAAYVSNAPGNPLEKIRADENVNVRVRALVRVLPLLFGHTLYEHDRFSIAVSRRLCDKVDIRRLIAALDRTVHERRCDTGIVDLADFMTDNGFVSDPDTTRLATHIAVNAMGCTAAGPVHIELPRTHIDVGVECYKILLEHGDVMHISAIFDAFKQRFPHHRFTSPEQLRRMLWAHPSIRSIGKQSTYGLDSWTHVYYGSIRDLLIDCLSRAGRPMPVEQLLEQIRRHYPESTASSLYSTMTGDSRGRFVQYADGFGLTDIQYAGATRREPKRSRHDFERRLDAFMKFIEREGRYPQRDEDSSPLENTLYSWRANILSRRLRIDPGQRAEFDRAMASIPQSVPRTRTETVFRHRTDAVIAADDLSSLTPRLRRWLRIVMHVSRPYGDSRDICLAELHSRFD